MRMLAFILIPSLIGVLAVSPGKARERGGQLSDEEDAYFNDVYGITLRFPDFDNWEFNLSDMQTDVRGEYVLAEILKAKSPAGEVSLVLKAATDPVLLGTGLSNWDFYSSLRRSLKLEPKAESVEYVFIHGFYEGIRWRYTARVGSRDFRVASFLVRRPGANFCLTFQAPADKMDDAWEEVGEVADTMRFYDSVLLGGELKRIFLETYR